jgi:hypothetical protein
MQNLRDLRHNAYGDFGGMPPPDSKPDRPVNPRDVCLPDTRAA